ncbi:MAG: hypothetical protein IJU48_00570 [Synergistaceae bacterium]|nr:hypothetical protein [Synergistaceae bacterium]
MANNISIYAEAVIKIPAKSWSIMANNTGNFDGAVRYFCDKNSGQFSVLREVNHGI